jgi:hypothetical protein
MVGSFSKAYGRDVIPMHASGAGSEVDELREMIGRAEEEARRTNERSGGWRTTPMSP